MEHWGRKARPTARAEHGRKVRVLLGVGVHRLAGLCIVKFWFSLCVRWKTFEGFLFDSHFNSVTGHFVKIRLENKGRSKRLLQ